MNDGYFIVNVGNQILIFAIHGSYVPFLPNRKITGPHSKVSP